MNTTTVATAVQRRWACHTRTVLPADAYGRQRCNVVVSACSVVYLWCMSWTVCPLERATKTDKILPVRTYGVRPHAENPGNRLTHSQQKKTLSACHASYSARMELKFRPTCPDGLPVSAYSAFCRKVLVRRDMFERRRKIHNYRYTYVHLCVFSPFGIFFLSGRGSFLVLSAPWHTGSPPGPHTQVWAPAEVRGPCSGG